MHKVIVVEDDRIIRRGICSAIPWEEHGFAVAGEAGDGEVALDLIKKEQPQVVISDINMPFMNGLEMTKIIKEISPGTRVIFLTGYEDFKYAHEAVKLRAFDYLLKPVDTDVLLKKAKEAAADWENEVLTEKRIIESMPLLQQKFFQKLIREGEERVDVEIGLADLGIHLKGPYFAVMLIKHPAKREEESERLKETTATIASSLFKDIYSVVMHVDADEFAVLLSLEDDSDVRKGQFAQELISKLTTEANDPVTVTLGRTYSNLFEVGKSFLEARLSMDMRHIMGTGRVFSFDEAVSKNDQIKDNLDDLEIELENQIKLGLPEKAKETLGHITNAIVERKAVQLSGLKILALKFSTLLFFEIQKWKREETVRFNSSNIYKDIMDLQSLTDMVEILDRLIEQWSSAVYQKHEKSQLSHVDQAIKYIKENYYDSSLTLQKVADFIFVSTPYLSNLFKLEKGFNFGDYLLELRMNKAMELFREEILKTYEVCEKVGYSNPQYFSICFKKFTGCTPAEYKKRFK